MRLPEGSILASSGRGLKTSFLRAPTMHTERRKTPRIPVRKLAYINFEPYNNGGVISDISGAGFRFCTVEPMQQGGLLRLTIILGAANQIEAVGELIWTDATRRNGGVRFAVLPTGAADQIRNWAEALDSAETSKSGIPPQNGESYEPPIPNEPSFQPKAASVADNGVAEKTSEPNFSDRPQAAPTQGPSRGPEPSAQLAWIPPSARPSAGVATPPQQSWEPPAAYQQPNAVPCITHFDHDSHVRAGSTFIRGLIGWIILFVILGTAAWFVLGNNSVWQSSPVLSDRPVASSPLAINPAVPPSPSAKPPSPLDTGNPLSPEQAQSAPAPQSLAPANPDVAPNLNTQTEPGAPAVDDAASQAQFSTNADGAAAPEIKQPLAQSPQLGSPRNPKKAPLASAALRVAKAAAEQPPQPAGESQLMLARQYLDGQGHRRNPTVASQLLWSAVEKGNSTAETTLADLYLRGDGVTRNCAQARVLLSAASSKGNPEAMQKLEELNRNGCG